MRSRRLINACNAVAPLPEVLKSSVFFAEIQRAMDAQPPEGQLN